MRDGDRWDSLRNLTVAQVASTVGLTPGRSGLGPCPACNAERRSSSDRRPPVGLRPDGQGWRCFTCDVSGDALDIAAWVREGARLKDLDHDGKARVCEALGGLPHAVMATPPRTSPTVRKSALAPEARALWAASDAVGERPKASQWFQSRGLDPAAIDERDIARVLPESRPTPPWARCGGWRWEKQWPVIAPSFDPAGALASLRARAITPSPPKGRKSVAPTGPGTAAGMVLACRLAEEMLRTGAIPSEWPATAPFTLIVVEGEVDFWTWGTRWPVGSERAAVVGIWSGSLDRKSVV